MQGGNKHHYVGCLGHGHGRILSTDTEAAQNEGRRVLRKTGRLMACAWFT